MCTGYIDADNGRRLDAAYFSLYLQAQHNLNLHVVDHARMKRVLFEVEDRAGGIEYHVRDELLTAHAMRLVVISAGAFCSPATLVRSPRGNASVLSAEEGGNVRCVGSGARGPVAARWQRTVGGIVLFHWGNHSPESLTHVSCGSGLDSGIKLRPTAQASEQLGANLSSAGTGPSLARTINGLGCSVHGYLSDATSPTHSVFGMSYVTMYPISTEHVHVRPADAFASLEISTGLFDSPDLMIDRQRREVGAVAMDMPEIQNFAADDEAIDAFRRKDGILDCPLPPPTV
ncbi:hypothetical protein DFH09DRAFT_1113129 [Mycena vulgaris]|nr:hypothetical protein DFH09DRAFT_1113129 [Mycena vulgaris]